MMRSCNDTDTSFVGWLIDRLVTLLCWAWFILGFLFCFSIPYFIAAFLVKDSEAAIQKLNSLFFRILFAILRVIAPSHRVEIASEVAAIRSAVIVCNHLSYLDPLLLICTFAKHRSIVKTRFFSIPIFGQVIKRAGYIPASGEGQFAKLMLKQVESMPSFLGSGGNLFVFPAGTRARNGNSKTFHPGALKIAKLCKAPIYVVRIQNTEVLFPPGKFVFNSRRKNTISVNVVGCIRPDYEAGSLTTSELAQQVQEMFEKGAL